MFKKSALSLCLVSTTLILTACGGSSLKDIPIAIASKPINMVELKNQASKNYAEVAKKNWDAKETPTISNYQITIGDKTYTEKDKLDLQSLGLGPTSTHIKEKLTVNFTKDNQQKTGAIETDKKAHLFQQNYSIVGVLEDVSDTFALEGKPEKLSPCNTNCQQLLLKGETTKTLPTAGTFNYEGVTMKKGGDDFLTGALNYKVDFSKKQGSGSIKFTNSTDITLQEATISAIRSQNQFDGSTISGSGIVGNASQAGKNGEYQLGFFGNNAQEIAGFVDLEGNNDNIDVIFGGTKK